MCVNLADTLPAIVGLPLNTLLLPLPLSLPSMFISIIVAIVIQIGGTLDLFKAVNIIEHTVKFFNDVLAFIEADPAVWFGETRQFLRADVLVLADKVLDALVLLMHHFAFPPSFLQLSCNLSVGL